MMFTILTLTLLGSVVVAHPRPGSAADTAIKPTSIAPARTELIKRQAVTEVPSECSLTSKEDIVSTISRTAGPPEIVTKPGSNRCVCGGKEVMMSITQGNNGQSTYFCATDGVYTAGSAQVQSTKLPEPTPGSADNAAWAGVQCSDGSLDDIFNAPEDQWNDSK